MWSDVMADRQVELAKRQIVTAFAVLTGPQEVLAVKALLKYTREWLERLEKESFKVG